MKPFPIVLSINLALFAIWGLVFVLVVDRPEYIPLFLGFQAALNFLGAGIFLLDGKKNIMVAFLIGLALSGTASGVGFALLNKYQGLIRLEEKG